MADLISRNSLLEHLGFEEKRRAEVKPGSTFYICLLEPAIDAVPVVRCKDCKLNCATSISVYKHCTLTGITVHDYDFCSYGERRSDD